MEGISSVNYFHVIVAYISECKHCSKYRFCNLMLEQRFGRSLLQVDKQSFELHNWLNVNKIVSDETSTQSPCSVISLHCFDVITTSAPNWWRHFNVTCVCRRYTAFRLIARNFRLIIWPKYTEL